MTAETIIHCCGTLEKREALTPIRITGSLDSLVFESRSPFWGYYDDYPGGVNDPSYLYLVIENRYSFFEMSRILLDVMKSLQTDIDLAQAVIFFDRITYHAIRVRNLCDTANVPLLQKTLVDRGVTFDKSTNNIDRATGHTIISKFFNLKKVNQGIYIDQRIKDHAYIELQKHVSFDDFQELVRKVRHNWIGRAFDSGLVMFLEPDDTIDVVRIYSKHVGDTNFLSELKKVFNIQLSNM